MEPLDYLYETFGSVRSTLSQSLRFDYGPNCSSEFYAECSSRLDGIEQEIRLVSAVDYLTIAARIGEIELLANWIALIERSHLGEFSWPFADHVRSIAALFLSESTLSGIPSTPIIHIVAEGSGYQILNERRIPATTGRQRFAVIKFPRHFKENVLLHPLFGHELGHTAVFTTKTGGAIKSKVLPALLSGSDVSDATTITNWLHRNDAPTEIKSMLSSLGGAYSFPNEYVERWHTEFLCDLFGLWLFGPCFVAAHKTLILSSSTTPFNPSETHPPYAARHRMLVRALRLLGWDSPAISPTHTEHRAAEQDFYDFVLADPYPSWASVFSDAALKGGLSSIETILAPFDLTFKLSSSDFLHVAVDRISRGIPPIFESLNESGSPNLVKSPFSHILQAGWIYWLGKARFKAGLPLRFEHANGLCNQALLQQTAINHLI